MTFRLIAFLIAMSVLVWTCFAQNEDSTSYGKVTGVVLGRDGLALPNATIRVEQLATNGGRVMVQQTITARTGPDGRYSLPNIRISPTPGEVRLRVTVIIDNQSVMSRGETAADELHLMRTAEIAVDFDLRKAPPPSTPATPENAQRLLKP